MYSQKNATSCLDCQCHISCVVCLIYNKPNIPREERFCKFCTEVETEEHFLISCHKYKDIRKTFFQSDGLDLKDSHNTYFLLFKLLNPKNIIECNYLYKFIRDALEIKKTLLKRCV
jgi:hypothetical protein